MKILNCEIVMLFVRFVWELIFWILDYCVGFDVIVYYEVRVFRFDIV